MQPPPADLSLRLDFVRQVHGNVADNIRLADAKAGFIAAAAVALLNVLTSRARAEASSAALSLDAQPLLSSARLLMLAVAVGASLAALLFAYFALRPQMPRTRSYIAFPELSRMTTEDFAARLEAETDAGLIAELMRDAIALSIIAVRKNQMVARAIRLLIGAAIAAALVLSG